MTDDELLKISEVAEIAKVLASTIRHYTDLGLLKVAGYTDGGHRLYSRTETLEKLAKIQALSKRGLTLPDIKRELEGKTRIKKVLVVDDEEEVRDLVTELLKLKFPQWQVRTASDGFMAGRMLGEFFPDLVILDLMMPGIDGMQVCRQIRNDPSLVGVSVLAITGYDSQEMRAKIMENGADDYLAKPMDNKILIEKVRKLLSVEDVGSSFSTASTTEQE